MIHVTCLSIWLLGDWFLKESEKIGSNRAFVGELDGTPSENYKRRKHERNPKTSKGDDNPGLLALADFLAEKRFWRGNINAANIQAYRQTLNSIPITP